MGYLELSIVFVGAIGLALVLGTGAALLRYRRTGTFPSQPADADEAAHAAAVRGSAVKLVLGAALTVAGVWMLVRVGAFG